MTTRTNNANYVFIVLSGFFILLGGCATVFAPGHDTIVINSEPEGADVYDGTMLLGKTPLQYSFKRNRFNELSIKMQGWKTQELQLTRAFDATSLGNFGCGFTIFAFGPVNAFSVLFSTTTSGACWVIDGASGKMIKYWPNTYLIEMKRDGDQELDRPQGYLQRLRFVVVNHADLLKDIARSGGPYLTSYFELRNDGLDTSDNHTFLAVVLREPKFYLTIDDPLVFFHALEAN